jgi:hypothetical protein
MTDYYNGIDRGAEQEETIFCKIYSWWDSLTDEEQYNLMTDYYPNDSMEDDGNDFFDDLSSDDKLRIWKIENNYTEEDVQGQKDMAGDMEYEERKLRGDDME